MWSYFLKAAFVGALLEMYWLKAAGQYSRGKLLCARSYLQTKLTSCKCHTSPEGPSVSPHDPEWKTRKGKQEDGISFLSGVFRQSLTAVVGAGGCTVTLSVDLQTTQPVGHLRTLLYLSCRLPRMLYSKMSGSVSREMYRLDRQDLQGEYTRSSQCNTKFSALLKAY